MKKFQRLGFYLNDKDLNIMNDICQKTNLNKSALLRHLIRTSKYLNLAKNLENHNNLISELISQIRKVGINLNQIAYHLNTDITTHNDSKTAIISSINELKALLDKYENKALKLVLDTAPKKFKKAENE